MIKRCCATMSYPREMRGSVTVHMAAPADRVWDLLSDVTRIGDFSPETFEAEWLDGASGPRTGARFRGHVKRNGKGPVYWKTCTVLGCEPGREFAFGVWSGNKILNTWRYRLDATADGTDVTESFELTSTPSLRLYWALLGWSRGRTNISGMRTTLERIKEVAESEAALGPGSG
jgi:Polyketide cyclase / dehydrase and lipid transport